MMYENMYQASQNETLNGTDWYDNGETFEYNNYWSSTESSSSQAQKYNFNAGAINTNNKNNNNYVRAVRTYLRWNNTNKLYTQINTSVVKKFFKHILIVERERDKLKKLNYLKKNKKEI